MEETLPFNLRQTLLQQNFNLGLSSVLEYFTTKLEKCSCAARLSHYSYERVNFDINENAGK